MTNRNLLYIGVPGSSVFQSQVLNLLREMNRKSYFKKIVLFIGIKKGRGWNKEIDQLEQLGIEVVVFRLFPNYNFFLNKQVNELKNKSKQFLTDNTIIHIRGESLAVTVKKIVDNSNYSGIRILADVRGASYEETKIYNKKKPIFFQFKLYQHYKNIKFINKNTDSISCVSQALKEYVMKRSVIKSEKVFVNHCVAGRNFIFSKKIRTIYRQKMNLSDTDILFLFVTGGNKKWQNTDEIISEIVSHGYKVLNMSKSKIDHKNVINLFVPYEEVPNYLNAADISIVWRNKDVVNHVASPVKFSEYVCSGLPVIANNGVDVINKYIENMGYGITINSFKDLNPQIINKLVLLDRDLISQYGTHHFGVKKITSDYISLYNKLLS